MNDTERYEHGVGPEPLHPRTITMHPAVRASRQKDAVIAGLNRELAELRLRIARVERMRDSQELFNASHVPGTAAKTTLLTLRRVLRVLNGTEEE